MNESIIVNIYIQNVKGILTQKKKENRKKKKEKRKKERKKKFNFYLYPKFGSAS